MAIKILHAVSNGDGSIALFPSRGHARRYGGKRYLGLWDIVRKFHTKR